MGQVSNPGLNAAMKESKIDFDEVFKRNILHNREFFLIIVGA